MFTGNEIQCMKKKPLMKTMKKMERGEFIKTEKD